MMPASALKGSTLENVPAIGLSTKCKAKDLSRDLLRSPLKNPLWVIPTLFLFRKQKFQALERWLRS